MRETRRQQERPATAQAHGLAGNARWFMRRVVRVLKRAWCPSPDRCAYLFHHLLANWRHAGRSRDQPARDRCAPRLHHRRRHPDRCARAPRRAAGDPRLRPQGSRCVLRADAVVGLRHADPVGAPRGRSGDRGGDGRSPADRGTGDRVDRRGHHVAGDRPHDRRASVANADRRIGGSRHPRRHHRAGAGARLRVRTPRRRRGTSATDEGLATLRSILGPTTGRDRAGAGRRRRRRVHRDRRRRAGAGLLSDLRAHRITAVPLYLIAGIVVGEGGVGHARVARSSSPRRRDRGAAPPARIGLEYNEAEAPQRACARDSSGRHRHGAKRSDPRPRLLLGWKSSPRAARWGVLGQLVRDHSKVCQTRTAGFRETPTCSTCS